MSEMLQMPGAWNSLWDSPSVTRQEQLFTETSSNENISHSDESPTSTTESNDHDGLDIERI